MWQGIKEFFTYTKKQRNGLWALVIVAVLLQLFLHFNTYFIKPEPQEFGEFQEYIEQWREQDSILAAASQKQHELFSFNPNTVSDTAMEQLGFPDYLAQRLIKYRSKGGEFKKPGDLQQLYGMDSALYNRLEAFVKIPSTSTEKYGDKNPFSFRPFDPNTVTEEELVEMGLYQWQAKRVISFREKFRAFEKPKDIYKVYGLDSFVVDRMLAHVKIDSAAMENSLEDEPAEVVMIHINTADSLDLLKLTGVGPFYAKVIRQYRDKLGGFYRVEQLLEVYGMDAERLEEFSDEIIIDEAAVKRMDVNTAGFKELLRHPYIEYEVVKNIVSFREDVRPFKSIEELKQLELIDEHLFSKIAKYLRVDESASD